MTIKSNDFDYISKVIREECGIILEKGKEYLIETRVTPLMRHENLESIESLVKKIKSETRGDLKQALIESMITNETSFFRDIHPFEILNSKIIPELIEKRKAEEELNIWCGASSSGQEPYSLAIIIKNNFPQINTWKINFLVSDISNKNLKRCKSGIYTQLEVNRGLSPTLLARYFDRKGMEWQVKDELRQVMQFQIINLAGSWPKMLQLDLVMMRNVLIYFSLQMRKKVLGKISKLLKADGYLFLGAAETTINLDKNFERIPFNQSGCYRLINE